MARCGVQMTAPPPAFRLRFAVLPTKSRSGNWFLTAGVSSPSGYPPGKQDYIVRADIKTPKGEAQPEVTVQIEGNERKDIGLHLTVAAPAKK